MASIELLRPHVHQDVPDNASTTPIVPRQLKNKSRSFILVLIALNIAVFGVALMNIIISIAIPKITDDFDSVGSIGWYAASYLLPTCAFQPHYGKLYARYSAKWVILAALGCFEAGILVSGLARNEVFLILGRATAGVGAAGVYSGALLIIAVLAPEGKTPLFQSSIGVVIGIASVSAPSMGGWLVDKLGWKWCFFANIPGGLISAAMLAAFLKLPPMARERKTKWDLFKLFDPVGTLCFLSSVVSLLLALDWAGTRNAWSSVEVLLLFVASGVLCFVFVVVQLFTGDNATIPRRIISQRTVAALSFFIFCLFGQFACDMYFIPLYFQGVKATTAVNSGINMIALIAAMVVAILASGALCARTGHYVQLFLASTVFMSIGNGLLTTLGEETPPLFYISFQIFAGVGTGLALQLPVTAIQAVLPAKDLSVGLATVLLFEFLGGALAVSSGNNAFVNALFREYRKHGLKPVKQGATTVIVDRNQTAAVHAYMEALRWPFRLSMILACLSIFGVVGLEWKRVKRSSGSATTESHNDDANGTTTTSFELKETAQAPSPRGSDEMPCYGCHDRPDCFLHSPPASLPRYPEKVEIGTARVRDFMLPRVPE